MPAYRAPFGLPIDELRDELDRLWNTLVTAPPLHGWGNRQGTGSFPAVNVRETESAVVVEAELPGLDAAAVDVSVSGDELVLTGSRPGGEPVAEGCCGGGSCAVPQTPADQAPADQVPADQAPVGQAKVVWHLRERGTGSFERRIPLPTPVDSGRVEARLVDGVLTVTCPKAAECRPRKVQVRSS